MNNKIYENKILGNTLKLPFLRINLEYNKKNNIEKKLNLSLGEIHKETGTFIRRINNYSSQFRKIGTSKFNLYSPQNINNDNQNSKINLYKLYNQLSQDSKKLFKLELTKTKEPHFISLKDILKLRLNKYKYKNRNKSTFFKTSSLDIFPSYEKINNCNQINYNLYDINNSFEITISKGNNKKENIEKVIIKKIPTIKFSRNTKKKTMNNIYKIHSIFNDMNKSFNNINYNLLNFYHDKNYQNTNVNNLTKINIKSTNIKNSKLHNLSVENDRGNYPMLFDPMKELLNKPLKKITIDNSKNNINNNMMIKNSTLNLLNFGQVSQSIRDDVFYRERKKILESYLLYEKVANINIKEKKKDYISPNIKLDASKKKIDNLIMKNKLLIKNICNTKIK